MLDSEVIGVYSEKVRGNVLQAFVVPAQMGTLSDNEVRSLCQNELGSAKTPKYVTMLESIPKTSTGKANIQELRNLSKYNDR